jgi:hypothetical protein
MNKLTRLMTVLAVFSAVTLAAQTPAPSTSPEASATPAKHKRAKKEASPAATATTDASPAVSPSPAKPKRSKKKEAASTAASPAASPAASASPAKKSWFGRKSTASPAPTASPATAVVGSKKGPKNIEPVGTPVPGGGAGMVWVNSETHVYHKEGSKWYGRTKKGKYMSEQDAVKAGNRADKEEGKAKKH